MTRRILLSGLAVAVLSCASRPAVRPVVPKAVPAPPSPEDRAPPALRLGSDVRPVRTAVDLTLDPATPDFHGSVRLELTLAQARRVLWVNATGLGLDAVTVEQGGRALPARVVPGNEAFVGVAVDEPLAAGPATVSIRFHGSASDKDSVGLFREEENGARYLFTQFEAQYARRVFPCLDQPDFKIPWALTLHVPAGLVAVANTPVLDEAPEPGGMRRVRFQPTLPLPSYLVAFGVGPFERVDLPPAGRKHTPMHLYMARGHRGEEALAVQAAPRLLALLEDYFDVPYPYEKLDLLAIPVAVSFGAMENAGLVTFTQRTLLAKPEERTVAQDRESVNTIAHEFAHQWFGDLVTTAWWDDIWLNEAFATWLTDKMLAQYEPRWPTDIFRAEEREAAFALDSLTSTRPVREPIRAQTDIGNVFDLITYNKGAAVIGMFEHVLGAATFQKGVQRYIRTYAFQATTAPQFLAAVSDAAGWDVSPAFSSFLDRPGLPLVHAGLSCDTGAGPTLALSQERLVPIGAKRVPEAPWKLPVCTRGDGVGPSCTLLTAQSATVRLGSAHGCPGWIWPDAGAAGYYVASPQGARLAALWRKAHAALTPAERVGLLMDARMLLRTGDVAPGDLLALVKEGLRDPEPDVLREVVWAGSLPRQWLSDAVEERYGRWVRARFGPLAHRLGFTPRPGESPELQLLRAEVLPLVAIRGRDSALVTRARALARAYLSDVKAVDPNVLEAVLGIAARDGDARLFDAMLATARRTPDRKQRQQLLDALAEFDTPALRERSLEVILSGDFDAREALRLLHSGGSFRTRQLVYDFVKTHFEALVRRFPFESRQSLTRPVARLCDATQREDAAAFFGPRMENILGGPLALDEALETVDQCIAQREALAPGLAAALSHD